MIVYAIAGCAAIWMGPGAASGQDVYRVLFSETFESGQFPAGLERTHKAEESNVALVDYSSPEAPAELREAAAAKECGRYGLRFVPSGENKVLGVMKNIPLDRASIPPGGRAVIQCDVFAANPPVQGVNAAIMALNQTDAAKQKTLWRFYRFGLSTSRAFFSFMNIQERPVIYVEDVALGKALKRPSWHRLQLCLSGKEEIHFAMDGVPAAFSPLQDNTLSAVYPGVIVTSATAEPRTIYMDNLSVMMTAFPSVPLPVSPWAPPSAPAASGAAGAPQIPWLYSPDEAWSKCQSNKRPILVLFYSPQAIWLQSLEKIMCFDPAAQKLLINYNLLKVDVKQPGGAQISARFMVFKTPCFVIIGPDGKELDRTVLQSDTPWPQVYDVLMKSSPQKP